MVKHTKSKRRGPGRPCKTHHKKTHHKKTHHKKTHHKKQGRPRRECRSTKLKKSCKRKDHCGWRKGTGCVRRPKRKSKSKSRK